MGEVPFSGAIPFNCAGAVFAQIVWFALIDPTITCGLTVMVTVLEVAGFPETHVAFDVIIHVIASLFSGVYAYVALVAPAALLPLTFHWYDGDAPPLTGVAVKVTRVPVHTGFADGAIETLTASSGLTIMVTVLEVVGFPETHVAFDVMTQVTASLFRGV